MVRSINRKTWLIAGEGRWPKGSGSGAARAGTGPGSGLPCQEIQVGRVTGSAGSKGSRRPQCDSAEHMDECNILFSYIIIIIIAIQWTRPHTHTHALRGTFDSYKWPVLVLWVRCGWVGERGAWLKRGDCNQSADINIFRVANHKLLRLCSNSSVLLPSACSPCAWTEAEAAQTVSLPWPVGPCVIRQPSMRIEWNHKLIKRDLFAACKGFCHTVEQETRKQQRKCALPLMFYCYSLWQSVLVLLCVCVLEN